MPEIVEILMNDPSEAVQFTVNTAVDFVTTVIPTVAPDYLYNGNGNNIFERGDNFLILSAGVVLPENFTLWKDGTIPAAVSMVMDIIPEGVVSGSDYFVYSMQDIRVPLENSESPIGSFVSTLETYNGVGTLLSTERFRLKIVLFQFRISMHNVPPSLNGKTLMVTPFIKIVHSKQLT